jgi:hypothetical protein
MSVRVTKKPLRGAELLLVHLQTVGAPVRRPAPRERLSAKLGEGFAGMLVQALAGDHSMRRDVA